MVILVYLVLESSLEFQILLHQRQKILFEARENGGTIIRMIDNKSAISVAICKLSNLAWKN